MKYLIEFKDDGMTTVWAGMYKDAPGFATKLEGARRFHAREEAQIFLDNSYGPSIREIGTVVEDPDYQPPTVELGNLP